MSTQDTKKIIVVARPGYQVLLNVGSDCLTIDAFTPVNLSDMFDETALNNCVSLSTHLRAGNLIYFEGQNLPDDPNSQKVNALRQSTAQHIQAQYTQAAVDAQHPNMQLATKVEDVNTGQEKTLQDKVAESRDKTHQSEKKMITQVRANLSAASDHSPAVDAGTTMDLNPTSMGPGLSKTVLSMKVAMDVNPETFASKQNATRSQLEELTQAKEAEARKEVESHEENQQPDA